MNDPYLIGLSRIPRMTAGKFRKLKRYFRSLEAGWHASEAQIIAAGCESEWAIEFIEARGTMDLDKELKRVTERQVHVIDHNDAEFPLNLREIPVAPEWLYVAGTIPSDPSIAVVGTRAITEYTERITGDLIAALHRSGYCITSGLALGIDAAAHRATLALQGKTVAVLGSGLDWISPREHTKLAERIVASGGAIVSEFPFDTIPEPYHFPQRNRIISGLSDATVIVGAGSRSGALITARFAMQQNRTVFAVPGSMYEPTSVGCHRLILEGATVLDTFDRILLDLGHQSTNISALGSLELLILKCIPKEPTHFDRIVRIAEHDAATVGAVLSLLEAKGFVKSLPGTKFQKLER